VQVRNSKTVALATLLLACTTPAKEHPADAGGAAVVPALKKESASGAARLTPALAPAASITTAPAEPTTPAAAAAPSPTGSAYFGCGEPIPTAKLWDETTESQVLEAISEAKRCAASQGRRLLLEFVAPWCADCQEMAKLDETPVVSETLRARFERVRVNVGKWDRHEALRDNFKVRALATYIVIDPKSSRVLAQTTLEPITKQRGKKLTAEDWAAWLKTK
jgi:thiol-disulfide isomerase/thioredoxin